MVIIQEEKEIIRYADKNLWFQEISNHFSEEGISAFWKKVYQLNDMSWDFISKNSFLPTRSVKDFWKLIRFRNFAKISMLPNLFRSVENILKSYKIEDSQFKNFIDEQLLITTQNTSKFAPMLTSSMGLAYPSETYYPYGGMIKFGEQILEKFLSLGGEILLSEKIISIKPFENNYKLEAKSGKIFLTKGVISNIPIWSMPEITEGKIQKYFSYFAKKYSDAPGAFVLNFVVEGKLDLKSAYYQVHMKSSIPFCDAKAVFVSFSLEDDFEKAPSGFHTVTVSTHTNPKYWIGKSKEEYSEQKKIVTDFIMENLKDSLPFLQDKIISYLQAGTPKTYEFYTGRKNGFVGGIPHSIKNNLLLLPPNQTPFKNFYMVGDSVFPGQGTPAVILSALNTVNRILQK
jgi:phytoene dehydrogenase-like protein